MKTAAFFIATLASAAAFAPAGQQRTGSTVLNAKAKKADGEKETFMSSVFGMDLFAPNKGVNDYGSRKKKNVSLSSRCCIHTCLRREIGSKIMCNFGSQRYYCHEARGDPNRATISLQEILC